MQSERGQMMLKRHMQISTHDTILAFDFWAVAKSDLQDIAQWVVWSLILFI